jgi:hypothetical protein
MGFLIDLIHRGGPLMFPLFFAAFVCLALFILRLRRARTHELPGLGLALVSSIVAIGLFGALQGEIAMLDAVAHASAEHKESMFSASSRITIVPLHTAIVLASIMALGFGATWVKVRHLDLPSPKGATAARILVYSSALLAFLGVGLYFYIRNWGLSLDGATEAELASFGQTMSTLIFSTLLIASVAWFLGVLGTIGSLISGLRGHRTPTEPTEG